MTDNGKQTATQSAGFWKIRHAVMGLGALLLAIVSSYRDRLLPRDMVIFGEVGLSGEIRPVPSGQERLAGEVVVFLLHVAKALQPPGIRQVQIEQDDARHRMAQTPGEIQKGVVQVALTLFRRKLHG